MRVICFIFILSVVLSIFHHSETTRAQSCPEKTAGACVVIQSSPKTLAAEGTAYLNDLYYFLLGSVGILSLGALVYGGVLYISAAANPSKTSEAKRWMWNAIYGILLTAFSFVILYTINPDLTKGFTLPSLSSYLNR